MSLLRSIQVKLVFWFLLIALAPLGAVLYASLRLGDGAIERSAIASMAAIAEARGAQLEAYARERVRNVSSIATGLAFIGAAQELGASYAADGTRDAAAYDAALAKYKARIDDFAKVCEFPRFLIIDGSGRVVYSTAETPFLHRSLKEGTLASTGLARVIDRVRRERRTFVSPPTVAEEGVRPSLEVVGPLLKGEEVVGFAAVTLAPSEIDSIVTDYTGLGATGDIVGVCRIGQDVVVTTPSRSNRDAAFTVRGSLSSSFAPKFQEIVIGNPHRGRGTDLEGDEVFGAWVRVQSLGWGLAVTQHVDEAFAPARAQRETIESVALYSIVPVVLLALLAARTMSQPATAAARGSE